jgi:HD-GYP domain-containing protein (c-di-GMP phosphodiesterase class II)
MIGHIKKAISHQEALAALQAQAGIQFDPALVNTFCISFEKGPGTRA